jgi:DegV family protein with EDD domain
MPNVAIVTDSSGCLPHEIEKEYEVRLVPVELNYAGKVYRAEVDISSKEIYALQRGGKTISTSPPSPGTFLETFRQLSSKTKDIFCLAVSEKYSGIFASMHAAIEEAKKELPQLKIKLMDCRTGAAAQGLITLVASRAAAMGKSLAEISEEVQKVIPKVEIILLLDTLYYIQKIGRAPKAADWITSLLKIKPLITNRLGEAHLLGVVRSRDKGIERIMKAVKQKTEQKQIHAVVVYSEISAEAEELKERIRGELDCVEIYVREVTPEVAVALGPGLIGIAFYAEDGDLDFRGGCNDTCCHRHRQQ